MRYRHVQDEDSDWTLQTYYDQFNRGTILNSEKVKTGDVDFQYRFPLGERNSITCGAGYRYIHSFCPSEDPFTSSIQPSEESIYLCRQLVQDEITLAPDLWTLTLGCRTRAEPLHRFRLSTHRQVVVHARPQAFDFGGRFLHRADPGRRQ